MPAPLLLDYCRETAEKTRPAEAIRLHRLYQGKIQIAPKCLVRDAGDFAWLYTHLGGVDAVPLCLATQDEDELVRAVELLEPSFGGINLEDIAQPRCFRVLERLRRTLKIPVWHDDQQGSAAAVLAGLLNALKLVGKTLASVRIAMIGMGAANFATTGS